MFITTSTYSKEAKEFVKNIESNIILIDGDQLTDLMIEHDIGVSLVSEFKVKRIDLDYFIED
ncbi:MAG: restriction endonuclease [Candidatus Marinimicrobia bacterium]|nr:restriction endonuclease [Candidatus Neomarinimicrobiota bacterium]